MNPRCILRTQIRLEQPQERTSKMTQDEICSFNTPKKKYIIRWGGIPIGCETFKEPICSLREPTKLRLVGVTDRMDPSSEGLWLTQLGSL